MTAPAESRAVRFDMPFSYGEATAGDPGGLRISPTGGLALAFGDGAIRQAIMILLATRPGERLARPAYGCPMHRLAFEPNDAATAGLAMHYIRTALARWEPRVEVVSLTARPDGAEGRLSIELAYRTRATGRPETLRLDIDLTPGGADADPGS